MVGGYLFNVMGAAGVTGVNIYSLFVAVVGLADKRLGFVVDDLLGQQDVVIKSLGKVLAFVKGIAGAAELGSQKTILVLDVANKLLYETWSTYKTPTGWKAGSGAIFDLTSDGRKLRPEGWTSADAAGLAILPGLVRYDEVKAGAINHGGQSRGRCLDHLELCAHRADIIRRRDGKRVQFGACDIPRSAAVG